MYKYSGDLFMFVSREKELALLSNILHEKNSSFLAIYGRRRIGKTELVRHFCKTNNLDNITKISG